MGIPKMGVPKMGSPGSGLLPDTKTRIFNRQGFLKWVPPAGDPASGHKNRYFQQTGVPKMGSPGRGACFRTQQIVLGNVLWQLGNVLWQLGTVLWQPGRRRFTRFTWPGRFRFRFRFSQPAGPLCNSSCSGSSSMMMMVNWPPPSDFLAKKRPLRECDRPLKAFKIQMHVHKS